MTLFEQFRKLPVGTRFFMFGEKIIYCKIGVKKAQALNSAHVNEFEISEHTVGLIKPFIAI